MASRPKRRFTSLCHQNTLLEAFQNKLDEGEEYFLGNRFIDEDDVADDYELESKSDNNESGNKADLMDVEQKIEHIEDEDVDMKNIVEENTPDQSENYATS